MSTCTISATLYRLTTQRDPLAFPPFQFVGTGRFDDPQRAYRVLYTSLARRGPFLERLQNFRASTEVQRFVEAFEWDGASRAAQLPIAVVPFAAYSAWHISELAADEDSPLFDLTRDDTLRDLETVRAVREHQLMLMTFYGASAPVPLTAALVAGEPFPYHLCKTISRVAFEDDRNLGGIVSLCKLQPDIRHATWFEGEQERLRARLIPRKTEQVSETDPDLLESAAFFGVRVETSIEFHALQVYKYGV